MNFNTLHEGDCLKVMAGLPDGCADMILCDLPYGVTQNAWDSVVPVAELWSQYKRVLKSNGAVVLTAQQPFTSALVVSNLKWFKYEWIWEKDNGTGFLNAKKQPLRNHESILVFYQKQPTYNPQMRAGKPYLAKTGATKSKNYGKQRDVHTSCTDGLRYPLTVVKMTRGNTIHPTQKPVALFEYLIRTYTNDGDTVLDNCAGSGTTAIAAMNTNRKYILIEKDAAYCDIIRRRIAEYHSKPKQMALAI